MSARSFWNQSFNLEKEGGFEMSSERMKTEEFWNPEHIVEKFWNGLKEGTIYASKCKE